MPAVERSEIQDVRKKGGECPTLSNISNMTLEEMTTAEDCLHLSIYTKNVCSNQSFWTLLIFSTF